jgi:hypothetical protein
MDTAFASDHKWDRNAFLGLVILAWVGILSGFGPEIQQHVAKKGFSYPLIVHVHAFLFVGWMILFTTQVLLIRTRRYDAHRKLGFVMAGWAVAMTVVGPATAWYMDRLEFGTPDGDPAFQAIQYGDLFVFAPLTAAAILYRRWPSAHKRLMLLGTLHISTAGFARVLAGPVIHLLGFHFPATMVALYSGADLLILGLGAYDLVTRKRLHPAYISGVSWVLTVQTLAAWLWTAPAWKPIATHLLGH